MRRALDWKFVLTLIVLVLVFTICFGFLRRVQQAESLIETAKSSAAASKQATRELRDFRRDSEARSLLATQQRDELAAQNDALQRQIKALTKYLKRQGIPVPTEPTARSSGVSSVAGGSGSGVSKPKPRPKPPSSTPAPAAAAPAPASSPMPAPSPVPLACVLGICLP